MKKLMFIIMLVSVSAICKTAYAQPQNVIETYSVESCYDTYDRYIPSGAFYGSDNQKIHYYGNGYFLVGTPYGNDYRWQEVYMDFRPLHRMILSRNRHDVSCIQIVYRNGAWMWMLSYHDIHYFGNNSNWSYSHNIPYRYSYCDWNYSYNSLSWYNNHRPHCYDYYHDNSYRGDRRRHQYSGHSSYGYYNNSRSINRANTEDRWTSSDRYEDNTERLRQQTEMSRRGSNQQQSYSSRESYRDGQLTERTESGNPEIMNGAVNGRRTTSVTTTTDRTTRNQEVRPTTTTTRRDNYSSSSESTSSSRSSYSSGSRGYSSRGADVRRLEDNSGNSRQRSEANTEISRRGSSQRSEPSTSDNSSSRGNSSSSSRRR